MKLLTKFFFNTNIRFVLCIVTILLSNANIFFIESKHIQRLYAQNIDVDSIISKFDSNRIFNTNIIHAELTVKNKLGTTIQSFTTYGKRNGDTLIVITQGADRGQKILRLSSSIYLYYPDAEEVIRLQGSALKDSVMGSDYSYEDLTGDNSIINNYNATLINTEQVDGFDCYHIILMAKSKNRTYQKQEVWIDTKLFVARKIILYSASGKALRQMNSTDFITVNGFNIAKKSLTIDLLKTGSSTSMEIKNIEINVDIPQKYFLRNELSW